MSNIKYIGPTALARFWSKVKDALYNKTDRVTIATSIPSGGMLPDVFYALGTLGSSATMSMANAPADGLHHEWMFEFSTGDTPTSIVWDAKITQWQGGGAPVVFANKTYQVSVIDGLAVIGEF